MPVKRMVYLYFVRIIHLKQNRKRIYFKVDKPDDKTEQFERKMT